MFIVLELNDIVLRFLRGLALASYCARQRDRSYFESSSQSFREEL